MKQITAIHILCNVSRSKSNQTTKFGPLIECVTWQYLVFKKSYTESVGETSSRTFSKKSNLSLFLNQQLEILYSLCFIKWLSPELPEYIETKVFSFAFTLLAF